MNSSSDSPLPWKTQTHLSPEKFDALTRFTGLSENVEDSYHRAHFLGLPSENLYVATGAIIQLTPKGSIGKNCLIGLYTYVNGDVTIEDEIMIGPHCCITSTSHRFDPQTQTFNQKSFDLPIRIKRGSWLATGVTINPGVTVGKGNLICANAVIEKDTEDFSIYAGTPAQKVGTFDLKTGDYLWKKN